MVVFGNALEFKKKKEKISIGVRDSSIYGRVKKSSTTGKSDSLSWIIQIVFCWSDNTRTTAAVVRG